MSEPCQHDFGPAAYDKGETHEAVAVVCVKCGYLAVRTEATDPVAGAGTPPQGSNE